jgi:hypothetical protein
LHGGVVKEHEKSDK